MTTFGDAIERAEAPCVHRDPAMAVIVDETANEPIRAVAVVIPSRNPFGNTSSLLEHFIALPRAAVARLIDDVYAAGVDRYVTGHAHSYERFAPQNPTGQRDDARGVRGFIPGTGGQNVTGFGTVAANSPLRFVASSSTPSPDSGTGSCHS